ncbi:MAG TPA: ferritin [Candidatus Omnitrophota bacterium]|nr:ferritin [Candidatus Omnitrophota bacterium]HPT07873.1 ferritin [Candidatus Omnitrophota bacterium]
MDKKLNEIINDQIKNELYSAYLYLAMAAYFESKNFPGFAHWMKVQAKEEFGHAMKFYDYVFDTNGRVVLQSIPQPPTDFASTMEVFEKTLAHEKEVTKLINNIYEEAIELNDNAATIFLQWFITEQVEEEKNATVIIETLKMIKPDSAGMIMYDHQLSKRE